MGYTDLDTKDRWRRELRTKIEILYDIEKLELLIIEAKKLLSFDPEDAYGLSMLGYAYRQLEKSEKAEAAAKNYLILYPNSADAHFLYGLILSDKKDYTQAEAEFQEAVKLDPADSRYYTYWAMCIYFRDNSNIDRAIALQIKALELEPENEVAHAFFGEYYLYAGKLIEAEQQCLTALKLNPEAAIVHSQYGKIQSFLGNFDKAEAHLLEALRIYPNDKETHNLLEINTECKKDISIYYKRIISHYINIGKIAEAEAAAISYIKEHPGDSKAYYQYGSLLYYDKSDIPGAIDKLKRAIELDSTNYKAYFVLANCLYEKDKKDIKNAIELLIKALKIAPRNALIHGFLSDLHLAGGNYEAAEKECLKARELDPESPAIQAYWAKMQICSANFDEGEYYIHKAYASSPKDPVVINVLRLLEGYQKDPGTFLKKIIRSYSKYAGIFPENSKAHLVLSKAYSLQGLLGKSSDELWKYILLMTDDTLELSNYVGMMYKLNKKEQLMQQLLELLGHNPGNEAIVHMVEALKKDGITCRRKKLFGIF